MNALSPICIGIEWLMDIVGYEKQAEHENVDFDRIFTLFGVYRDDCLAR